MELVQAEAGRLQEAAALHREALQENPDDWGSLLAYLDCRLPGSAAGRPPPPAGAAVEQLTESTLALSTSDGPVAGEVEVRHCLIAARCGSALSWRFADLCCKTDVEFTRIKALVLDSTRRM